MTHSVREVAREQFLADIQKAVCRKEEIIGTVLYPLLVNGLLVYLSHGRVDMAHPRDVPISGYAGARSLVFAICEDAARFASSDEERMALVARMFVWTAEQAARAHLLALKMQEGADEFMPE